jgi:phage baseplate assembly protein W
MPKQPVYYEDLSLDPQVLSDGNISTETNEKSIKQGLRMLINTGRGTRIFLPDYGCRIKSFLFQPFDETTANQIGLEIEETLRNYEKRIEVLNVTVEIDWKTSEYNISVVYRVVNTQTISVEKFNLEKL